MSENRLVIVCARPGLHRGGLRHPPVATYTADQLFAAGVRHAHLVEMAEEPELTLVFGRLVTADDLTGEAGPGGLSLVPQPMVSDAGWNETGLAHGVQPVAVVRDGEVVGTVAATGAGPLAPTPPSEGEASAQAEQVVEAAVDRAAKPGRKAR